MVINELEKPPETFVLTRGDFLHPDREHGALALGIPATLNIAEIKPTFSSRLDLARWLVSRENPLTGAGHGEPHLGEVLWTWAG